MSAEKAGLRVRLREVRFQPSFSLESTLLGKFRLGGFRSVYVELDRRKKAAGYFLGIFSSGWCGATLIRAQHSTDEVMSRPHPFGKFSKSVEGNNPKLQRVKSTSHSKSVVPLMVELLNNIVFFASSFTLRSQ